jgi:hypothetical protein
MNSKFKEKVSDLKRVDQATRKGNLSDHGDLIWNYLVYCVDYVNGQRLKELISQHGYPSKDDDPEFVSDLTLLVIHQDFDVELQKKYLNRAALSEEQKAWLEDRIAMNENRPQKNGTLFKSGDGNPST